MKKAESFWGEHELPTEPPQNWTVGDITIWGKRVDNEVWLAHKKESVNHHASQTSANENDQQSPEAIEKKLEWSRWSIGQEPEKILVNPIFPNYPVVVKPETPFRLRPKIKTKIFIRIPLWVKISLPNASDLTLIEIPSVQLSYTWFGKFTEGELCYWISSSARVKAISDLERPHLAICPVNIKNQSNEDLLVEKVCLRVNGLSLFILEGQLWANETNIAYRGSNDISRIEVSNKAPSDAPKAKKYPSPESQAKELLQLERSYP